jgi:hypothetical protein
MGPQLFGPMMEAHHIAAELCHPPSVHTQTPKTVTAPSFAEAVTSKLN